MKIVSSAIFRMHATRLCPASSPLEQTKMIRNPISSATDGARFEFNAEALEAHLMGRSVSGSCKFRSKLLNGICLRILRKVWEFANLFGCISDGYDGGCHMVVSNELLLQGFDKFFFLMYVCLL